MNEKIEMPTLNYIKYLEKQLDAETHRASGLEDEINEICLAVGYAERPEGQDGVHRASGSYVAQRFHELEQQRAAETAEMERLVGLKNLYADQRDAEKQRADQHLATVGELRKVIDRLENDNRRLRDLPLIGQHVERCPSPPALTADDVTMIVHNILRQRDLNDSARRACAGPPLQADDVREIARDEAKQMILEAYSGVEDDDFHGFMGALK